eukprot:g1436.t1
MLPQYRSKSFDSPLNYASLTKYLRRLLITLLVLWCCVVLDINLFRRASEEAPTNVLNTKSPGERECVSIVVPVYHEAENIKFLYERVAKIDWSTVDEYIDPSESELVLVDDSSEDGSDKIVETLAADPENKFLLRFVERRWEDDQSKMESTGMLLYPVATRDAGMKTPKDPVTRLLNKDAVRGLSGAVLDGFTVARCPIFVVMDADLSHPPEKIPALVEPLVRTGTDRASFTIGSRYTKGGSIENWPLHRRIISIGARTLTLGLSASTDPLAGFMGLRKSLWQLAKSRGIYPKGFKISLELMVKAAVHGLLPRREAKPALLTSEIEDIPVFTADGEGEGKPRQVKSSNRASQRLLAEVPIHFSDRQHGTSKLKTSTCVYFILQLVRLYLYVYQITAIMTGLAIIFAILTFRGIFSKTSYDKFGHAM